MPHLGHSSSSFHLAHSGSIHPGPLSAVYPHEDNAEPQPEHRHVTTPARRPPTTATFGAAPFPYPLGMPIVPRSVTAYSINAGPAAAAEGLTYEKSAAGYWPQQVVENPTYEELPPPQQRVKRSTKRVRSPMSGSWMPAVSTSTSSQPAPTYPPAYNYERRHAITRFPTRIDSNGMTGEGHSDTEIYRETQPRGEQSRMSGSAAVARSKGRRRLSPPQSDPAMEPDELQIEDTAEESASLGHADYVTPVSGPVPTLVSGSSRDEDSARYSKQQAQQIPHQARARVNGYHHPTRGYY